MKSEKMLFIASSDLKNYNNKKNFLKMIKFFNLIKNLKKPTTGFFYSATKFENSGSNFQKESPNINEVLELPGSEPKKSFKREDLKEGGPVRRWRNAVALDQSGARWRMKKAKPEKEAQPAQEFGVLNKPE